MSKGIPLITSKVGSYFQLYLSFKNSSIYQDICRHSAIEEEEEEPSTSSGLRFRVRGCPPLNRCNIYCNQNYPDDDDAANDDDDVYVLGLIFPFSAWASPLARALESGRMEPRGEQLQVSPYLCNLCTLSQ